MSLSEDLMKPTAMLYRKLLAIEVEETIRSQPLDGIVALGNCDETVPAYLMALASADIPGLVVTGGFRVPALFDGSPMGSGTALWRLYDSRRSGSLDYAAWARLDSCLGQGLGACNTMGTASTMAIMAETLGLALPGSAVLASGDPRQSELAEAAGRRIVSMVGSSVRPSSFLTVPTAAGPSLGERDRTGAVAGREVGDVAATVHGGAWQPGAFRRGDQGSGGQPFFAAASRAGGGAPLVSGDAQPDRLSFFGCHSGLGPGACWVRARGDGHARVGQHPDPF